MCTRTNIIFSKKFLFKNKNEQHILIRRDYYEMQSPFVKDNDNFQDMQEIKSQNVSRF